MEKPKLRACPWCKCADVEMMHDEVCWFVWCRNIECQRPEINCFGTEEEALADWNKEERNDDAFMHMVADEIPEQYARIAGQMVDFKTEDLTDAGRELLLGEKREEWIPVTERLPDLTEQIESDNYCVNYSKDVLIWSPMNKIPLFEIARYTDDRGWTDPYFTRIKFQGMITHWMPLPQPPEVQE